MTHNFIMTDYGNALLCDLLETLLTAYKLRWSRILWSNLIITGTRSQLEKRSNYTSSCLVFIAC